MNIRFSNYSALIALALLTVTSCVKQEDIDNLQSQIDEIKTVQIATIDQQIAGINTSLASLQETDKELKGYISTLQNTAAELLKSINSTNDKIDLVEERIKGDLSDAEGGPSNNIITAKTELLAALAALRTDMETQFASITNNIVNLQEKETALKKKIDDLKSYVNSEIKDSEDWVNVSFATLEQYKALVNETAAIKANITSINTTIVELESRVNETISINNALLISALEEVLQQNVAEITQAYKEAIATARGEIEAAYTNAIATAIASSESTMHAWVNGRLTGYYTIAEVNAKVEQITVLFEQGDESLSKEITTLEQKLDKAKSDLSAAYQQAIASAITENNGIINAKIASDISAATNALQQQIDAINTRIDSIESRVATLESNVEKLINRIQSIVVIPSYSDGSVACTCGNNIFYFEVLPSGSASRLAAAGKDIFKLKAVYTQTKAAPSFVNLPISSVRADGDILMVTASASGLTITAERSANAVLTVTSGVSSISTGYFPLYFAVRSIPEDAVDLGLSVYWSKSNLSETGLCANPEDYGDYYAWGEIQTHYESGYAQSYSPVWKSGKTGYDWEFYGLCNGSSSTLTKYNLTSDLGNVDNKTVLEDSDDVAHVKLGDCWRMPTDAEWTELMTQCTWTWTVVNGVSGRLVTAPNDNCIFLPAAGDRDRTHLYHVDSYGGYWSASLNKDYPYYAWFVSFGSINVDRDSSNRYVGHSVRPVYK